MFFLIILGDLIILFSEQEKKFLFSNLLLIVNSLAAALISLLAIYYNFSRKRGIAIEDILLTGGLVFWFLANVTWAYYEIILHIVTPVPSLADILLLSGYVSLIFRLFIVYKKFHIKITKKLILLVSFGGLVFLVYMLSLTLDLSVTSTPRGQTMFVITVIYPLLNTLLAVFSIIILASFKKEKDHSVAWLCELVSFLVIILGDSWFAIIAITQHIEGLWISVLLLSGHYIIIAGGLFWYIKVIYRDQKDQNPQKMSSLKLLDQKKKIALIVIPLISFSPIFGYLIYKNNYFYNTTILIDDRLEQIGFELIDHSNSIMNNETNVIKIGAIVPLTGAFSSIGEPTKIALEQGEKDINSYLKSHNIENQIKLLIANSKTDPKEILKIMEFMKNEGVKIILGPATSSAVLPAKDYADKNNIILISYASTSPELSIPDDNLFRFVPDDTNQAQFITKKMWDDGIKTVVPIWRGDSYGNALQKTMRENFEKLGGKVLDGVKYNPYVGSFSSSLHRINFIMWNQDLKRIDSIVENAINKATKNSVAVYLIGFDEVIPILIQANEHKHLDKVRWYGSDGSAQNAGIIKNYDSANFAFLTNFTNPLYSIHFHNDIAKLIENEIEKKLHGHGSLTYPLMAYDAFWVAVLSSNHIKESNITDIESIKKIILNTTLQYDGITGKIILNKAGDRIGNDYDLWMVKKDKFKNDKYVWSYIK